MITPTSMFKKTIHLSNDKSSKSVSWHWDMPLGYWNTGIDLSHFSYLSTVSGTATQFETSGTNLSQTLFLSRTVYRDQSNKLKIRSSLERKKSENFIEDTLLDSSRILSIATIRLEYDKYLPNQSQWQLALSYYRGLSLFDAPNDKHHIADSPKAQFDKVSVSIDYQQHGSFNINDTLAIPLLFQSKLQLQQSDDRLFGSEQISIGSLYTVRGYKNSSISAASGGYWRNSLTVPWRTKWGGRVLQNINPFIALDIGVIKDRDHLYSRDTYADLMGGVIGVQLSGNYYGINIVYARPLNPPKWLAVAQEQWSFNLTLSFEEIMRHHKDNNKDQLTAIALQTHPAYAAAAHHIQPHWHSKLIVYTLAFLIATQPLLLTAQTIIANTAQTQQLNAANGVPIINIATPSAKGVSHNRFQQFNVDPQGLILNNAKNIAQSQLGGFIDANPNLQSSNAASLIINEVTAPNRSQLNGYTEVAGQAANVIIANPYGITCNGCGFINTPRVSLTSGTPTIQNGELTRFSVNGGDIRIDGLGLNASNISQFDIISRAVKVNAALHAKQLNIILGTNHVDYVSLTPTAVSSDNSTEFALDSSALGGMYANAIHLIGTKAGVGVRTLGNVASSVGQLSLSVDGKISVNTLQSAGDLTLTSHSSNIELKQQLRSNQSIHISAQQSLINDGITTAFNDITINANNVMQQGILASGVTLDKNANKETVYLINRSGKLSITTNNDITNSGRLASGGHLDINAASLTNQETGDISSGETLTVIGDNLTNQGTINSVELDIQLSGALINSATIEAEQRLELHAATVTNDNGIIDSQGNLDLDVTQLSNLGGLVQAANRLTLTLPSFNFANGIFNAGNSLIINTQGDLTNGIGNQLLTGGLLTINTDGSINNYGEISSFSDLTLNGTNLTNYTNAIISATNDLTLNFSGDVSNTGRLSATNDLWLSAVNLSNSGTIAAGHDLQTTLIGNLDNYNTLFATNDANLYVSNRLQNYEGANIFALNNIIIAANERLARNQKIINGSATIEAYQGNITLYAGAIINRKVRFTVGTGKLIEGRIRHFCYYCENSNYELDWIVTEKFTSEITANSTAANIIAGNDIVMEGGSLRNEHSLIAADNNITLQLEGLDNISAASFVLTRTSTYYERNIEYRDFASFVDGAVANYNRRNRTITLAAHTVSMPNLECTVNSNVACPTRIVYGPDYVPNPNYDPDNLLSVPTRILRHGTSSIVDVAINTGQASSASIQAGGAANITIAGVLNNGDVQQNAGLPTHTSRSGNTAANGRELQAIASRNLTLPTTDGLFVVNRNVNHPYLVETNPEFTLYTNFISSDYFFNQIGLKPELIPRRLGDGFYETRLIRDAIFATKGRRYLAGQSNDQTQFKYLMDNAIASKDTLDLAVGIALNADQVARLTHDIIWMVEQQVQDQTVLVPVYYAAVVRAGELHASGSLLAAATLSLSAGDINNTGDIAADEDLTLSSANNLLNRGSLRSGADLSVTSQNNILNLGGHIISSGNMLLVARTGDLELGRDVKHLVFQRAGRNEMSQIGTQSKIQSGGDAILQAKGDISLIGSTLTAANDISLAAQGDISVEALQDRKTRTVSGNNGYHYETENIRQLRSNIKAGGNLSLN